MTHLDENFRRLSAYHEAGHAVAAHLYGMEIEILDIHCNDQHGGNFRVKMPEDIEDPSNWRYSPLREFVEHYGVVLMAGMPASLLSGLSPTSDFNSTWRTDMKALIQDAIDAFAQPWTDAWVKTMEHDGRDEDAAVQRRSVAQQVIEQHRKLADHYFAWIRLRAEALVAYSPHQRAIEAVAEQLLELGSLAGQNVHELIAATLLRCTAELNSATE